MIAATRDTVLFARNGYHARACVYDKSLRLLETTKQHGDVKIVETSRISIERSRVNWQVRHLAAIDRQATLHEHFLVVFLPTHSSCDQD